MKNYKFLVAVFVILTIFLTPYTIYSDPNGVEPHIEVAKSINPTTINCQLATVTLNVYGKGEPSIEHNPIDVMLILDRSGSMAGTKITDAKEAAKTFITFLVDSDRAGLVSYSTTATLDQGLKHMDNINKTSLNTTIDSLTASGVTNIYEALGNATLELQTNGRSPPIKLVEILLTDGVPTAGPSPYNTYIMTKANEAAAAGIVIFTIGLGPDVDETLLGDIANITGGQYYFASNSSELGHICIQILQKLFNSTAGESIILDDILPSYVNIASPLPSECVYYAINRTISCDLGTMEINDIFTFNFDVDVNMLGNNRVDVYPDSGVSYVDYLGNKTFTSFPETNVTVTGYANATEICNDGFDNDCDQFIDCADSDCGGQEGPGGIICCGSDSDCPQANTMCYYLQRKYCTRDEFGICSLGTCFEDSWICGDVDDVDYCTNCNHCGDGECNCGETIESCLDDCSGPTIYLVNKTINVKNFHSLDWRFGNYLYTGELINYTIIVRDYEGSQDIANATTLANMNRLVYCIALTSPSNGYYSEIVPGGFNSITDKFLKCALTITPSLYGDVQFSVEAEDRSGKKDHLDIETIFINPAMMFDVETNDSQPIQFEDGYPGGVVYSKNKLIVTNMGEGENVAYMYIAGTDMYSISIAKCPYSNALPVEQIEFRAKKGENYSEWQKMGEYRGGPGGCNITNCYDGIPLFSFPDNILHNQESMEVEFRLNIPMPCIGDFSSSGIFIFGVEPTYDDKKSVSMEFTSLANISSNSVVSSKELQILDNLPPTIYLVNKSYNIRNYQDVASYDGHYIFMGDEINYTIIVRDLNGKEDIGYAKGLVDISPTVLCAPLENPPEGYFDDVIPNGFNSQTDKLFDCIITIAPFWYGDVQFSVEVEDLNGAENITDIERFFVNPGISLDVSTTDEGPILFEKGGPGEIVHSLNHIIVKNMGEGAVSLFTYIDGTNLYSTSISLCPETNVFDIRQIEFRTKKMTHTVNGGRWENIIK